MNRDDKVLAVYPPHPEEGASTCAAEKRNRRVAPVSKRMGGHRSRVYPRSASNARKSGRPDFRCSRRRARGCGIWRGLRSRLLTTRPGGTTSASNQLASALVPLEILQVRGRLPFLHRHDGAVAALEIDLLADGDVSLALRTIVLGPKHGLLALEGLHHGPWPRQRAVGRGHLDAQHPRIILVEIDPLLDHGVVVLAHRQAGLVPHPRPAQMPGFDLERVIAAVVVGIEPFADGVADEPALLGFRPVAPVGVDAAR